MAIVFFWLLCIWVFFYHQLDLIHFDEVEGPTRRIIDFIIDAHFLKIFFYFISLNLLNFHILKVFEKFGCN